MHSISDLARRFGLPESTARFYCKRFRDFLPHAGEGKRRRYLPEAVTVFQSIVDSMGRLKNADLVQRELEESFGVPEMPLPVQGAPMAPATLGAQEVPAGAAQRFELLFARQTQALEDIAQALTALRTPAPVAPLDQSVAGARLGELETQLQELGAELKRLQTLQDDAERLHQQDLEQLRKWLARMAKEQSRERDKG